MAYTIDAQAESVREKLIVVSLAISTVADPQDARCGIIEDAACLHHHEFAGPCRADIAAS
jgi:hypothetical protein